MCFAYLKYLWCLSKNLHNFDEAFDYIKRNRAWVIDSFPHEFHKSIFEDFLWAKAHPGFLWWLEEEKEDVKSFLKILFRLAMFVKNSACFYILYNFRYQLA